MLPNEYQVLLSKVKELQSCQEYCKTTHMTLAEKVVEDQLQSCLLIVKNHPLYQGIKSEKFNVRTELRKLHIKQKELKLKVKKYQNKFTNNATAYNKGKVKKYLSLLNQNRHEINKMNYELKSLI